MRALIFALAATGCAASQPVADGLALDRHIAGRVAGPPQRCVSVLNRSDGLQAVDSRTLIYRRGSTIWVNHLAHDCPGLRPLTTLIVDIHGDRYCRGDRVRTIEPGTHIPGPLCALGDFTPYVRAR